MAIRSNQELSSKEFEAYKSKTIDLINNISLIDLEKMLNNLKKIQKNKNRLFIAGMGGSAANASHANNDFRKLCNINSICLIDNVSELTARINDKQDESYLKEILKGHFPKKNDCLMIFSVGGGSKENYSSISIVELCKFSKKNGISVLSIVGKKNSLVKKYSDVCLELNFKDDLYLTPISETIQPFIWHFLVSSKHLMKNKTKW